MSTDLLRSIEVHARIPATGQLLDGGDINQSVVQMCIESWHVLREEHAIDVDRRTGQWRLASFGNMLLNVGEDSFLGDCNVFTGLDEWQQSGLGMHIDHERIHGCELGVGSADNDVDAFVNWCEICFGHERCDFDEDVLAEIEPGHLAIDPYESLLWAICSPRVFVELGVGHTRILGGWSDGSGRYSTYSMGSTEEATVPKFSGSLADRLRGDARIRLMQQAWPVVSRALNTAVRNVVGLPRLAIARVLVAREQWDGVIRVLRPHVVPAYPLARSARVLISAYGKVGDFEGAYSLADRLARLTRLPSDIARSDRLRGRVWEVHPAWLPAVSLPKPDDVQHGGPRRVLYLAKESAPYLHNGFCTRSHETLRAVKSTGTEIVAVTMPGFPAVIDVTNAPGEVVVDDITYKHLMPNSKLATMPVHEYLDLAATTLAKFVLEYRPTVLHIGSGHRGYETALVGRAVAEWFGIPWMYEVRSFFETTWTSDKRYMESAPYFHQRHATESRCMRAADYVVTLSGPMRDEIIERHGITADKVTGIPNAVDVERFAPQSQDASLRERLGFTNAIVLGYVSNLSHPREGQEALIAALPKIRAAGTNAKVLLVGDGARRPHLESLARKLGVAEHVVFTGSIPFDQVSAYYAQIDLFVVPRTNERAGRLVSPMKPFEAMAMGIPLLVSDLPALVEIVSDTTEPRGFSYRAEDPADLARVAIECLADPAELRRRADAAAAWVRRERTWAANGRNFVRAYEQAEQRWQAVRL